MQRPRFRHDHDLVMLDDERIGRGNRVTNLQPDPRLGVRCGQADALPRIVDLVAIRARKVERIGT